MPSELGRGYHGVVHDEGDGSVRKLFGPAGDARAHALAASEFDRLTRLSRSLAGETMVTCPEPYDIAVDERGVAVRMAACPGRPLHELFMQSLLPPHRVERIARGLAIGAEVYVASIGAAACDYGPHNALYDASRDLLTILDFAQPSKEQWIPSDWPPLSSTIGCFVGATAYESVRPAVLRAGPLAGTQLRQVGRAAHQALAARHDLDVRSVRRAAWISYRVGGFEGAAGRRGWYAGPGLGLARLALRSMIGTDGRCRAIGERS